MATVRTLGLFSLPNLPLGESEQDFLQGRLRCPHPAEAFTSSLLGSGNYTIAPADLAQSTYTALDLDRAMLWLWRVKTFTVTGSVVVEDENYQTTYELNIGPVLATNRNSAFSDPIQNEKEKVCDCGMFYGEEQSEGFEDGEPGAYSIKISIAAVSSIWANFPNTPAVNLGSVVQRVRINQAKTQFYIPVLISVSVRSGNNKFDYESGSSVGSSVGSNKNISWEIEDALGSLSRPFRFGGDEASGIIQIAASEYWPYDPGDSLGPIYDKDTGRQLRPFP